MMLREEGYLEVYFGDEAHFGLTPNVPYAWQHKDNPILLPSKKSQSLTVFGLMNIDCKVYSHITIDSMNSTKLITCLDEFGASIVKKTIIILDNASIHRSKLFKAKIEEWKKLDLYIYFLPPYSQVSEQINRARKVLVSYLCNCKYNKFHTNPFYAHENKNREKVRESHLQTNIRFDSSINSQEIYLRL